MQRTVEGADSLTCRPQARTTILGVLTMWFATVTLWFSGLHSCSSHLYTWVRAVAALLLLVSAETVDGWGTTCSNNGSIFAVWVGPCTARLGRQVMHAIEQARLLTRRAHSS